MLLLSDLFNDLDIKNEIKTENWNGAKESLQTDVSGNWPGITSFFAMDHHDWQPLGP